MQKVKIKKCFTLAEILITLGIIGVISAVTIPIIMNSFQKMQTATLLKKTYADLQNAIKLSVDDNGDPVYWMYPSNQFDNTGAEGYLKQYWLPYLKNSSIVDKSNKRLMNYDICNIVKSYCLTATASLYTISLSDGRLLSFRMNNRNGGYIWLFADINGFSGPNVAGKDIFVFDAYNYKNRIIFWGEGSNSRSGLKNSNSYGCNLSSTADYMGYYCGAWIKINNWTIPKDYPW